MSPIQSRKCGQCGHDDTRILSNRDAAFEETRLWPGAWTTPCERCQSTNIVAVSADIPVITREILEEWVVSPNLHFDAYGEVDYLGDRVQYSELLPYLSRPDMLQGKRWVIAAAVCLTLDEDLQCLRDKEQSDCSDSQTEQRIQDIAAALTKQPHLLFEIWEQTLIADDTYENILHFLDWDVR